MESTFTKLDASRRELLDLGLRNSLLNYRPTKARGLEIVDERPASVYELLVLKQKAMTFLSNANEHSEEDGYQAPETDDLEAEDGQPAERHIDLHLQTPYTSANLQKRLLATYHAAREFVEERGFNVLFLALGMLTWYESDSSDQPRRAPLLMIPVSLERENIAARFRLWWSDEDIDGNLSLTEKMRTEWGITIPSLTDSEGELSIQGYFNAVKEAIAKQPRWSVDDRAIALDFFSFGKLLMYKDLEPQTWDGPTLAEGVVSSLLEKGFRESESPYSDDQSIDQFLDPSATRFVMDADSSQATTILDAREGRNFVVQGPPGTGKSQTITNLLADCIGRGQRVLFVAEKMAALEVVKRRLDSVGLGFACLELHSHKSNKRSVLNELRMTMDLGKPVIGRAEEDMQELRRLRDRLNAYAAAMNVTIGDSGVTPYGAIGRLLPLKESCGDLLVQDVPTSDLENWTSDDARRKLAAIGELQNRLSVSGALRSHPFWGATISVLPPTMHDQISRLLQRLLDQMLELRRAVRELTSLYAISEASSIREIKQLLKTSALLRRAPSLSGLNVATPEWVQRSEAIERMIAAGTARREIIVRNEALLIPEAYDQDLLETRQSLIETKDKWWKFFSGKWRRAKKKVRSFCKQQPASGDEMLALVEAIMEAQRLKKEVEQASFFAASLFGPYWNGPDSDWVKVDSVYRYLREAHDGVADATLHRETIRLLTSSVDVAMLGVLDQRAETALSGFLATWDQYTSHLRFSVEKRFTNCGHIDEVNIDDLDASLEFASHHLGDLYNLVAVNQSLVVLEEEKLQFLFPLIESDDALSISLREVLQKLWFEALLNRAYRERKALSEFEGRSHDGVVERFREMDKLVLQHTRALLAQTHWQGLPRSTASEGQLAILRRELEKKTRHMPIRRLLERAGRAIQAVKPIFMMSPMSVAAYLPQGAVDFDLVVFDEASQVQPVDALGALMRGKQAIVVGDSKQLPPTSFFDRVAGGGDYDDEEEVSATGDLESVLGLFLAQGAPQRMLRWHYRSRHESLITVSNMEFYENRLVIFPSPDHSRRELGLVFNYLPEARYDAGKSRTNREEARIVAEAVMKHAAENPHLSLGVAAFSITQAEAIRDQVEQMRRLDSSFESFFQSHPFEPFFVKNLESVQGDERDVILLSVGYGPDINGKVSMNFGPLNKQGGERRLNVLITRSRCRCEVFTSLTAQMIDLDRTSARGVAAFRQFLHYAEHGALSKVESVGGETESYFEDQVLRALQERGYRVDAQVGSGGFFIDLAVEDPDYPGRYLLGIECDGASYHSARTARDRDRLRQAVLEGMGWNIHRIWSTDWFRDPARELQRLTERIEKAKALRDVPVERKAPSTNVPEIARTEAIAVDDPLPVSVYTITDLSGIIGRKQFQNATEPELVQCVLEIVRTESPVHHEEVFRRIADAYGARMGARVRGRLEDALAIASRQGMVDRRGDFCWIIAVKDMVVRDRSSAPSSTRQPDHISPEEMQAAVLLAVKSSHGLEAQQLPTATARLFGLQATAAMRAAVEREAASLLSAGKLRQRGSAVEVV